MGSGSGTSEGVGPVRCGWKDAKVGSSSRAGRRSKEEIYRCSDGGQEVGRREGRGGGGEGQMEPDDRLGRPRGGKSFVVEDDARRSVFPSVPVSVNWWCRDPLLCHGAVVMGSQLQAS